MIQHSGSSHNADPGAEGPHKLRNTDTRAHTQNKKNKFM